MYDAPPGMQSTKQNDEDGVEAAMRPSAESTEALSRNGAGNGAIDEVTKVRSGDDAAAAAFRQMLAAHTSGAGNGEYDGARNDGAADSKLSFAPVLQGSTAERMMGADKKNGENTASGGGAAGDALSALEKSVGRKLGDGALTLQEQVERFPQLQNAPMVKGMSGTNVNVSFKPLGAQVRNIKCLACGVWGHSRGERECKVTGWDPFSMSASRPALGQDSKAEIGIKPSQRGPKQEGNRSDEAMIQHDRKKSSVTEDEDEFRRGKKRRKKDRRRRSKKHRRNDDHSFDSESDSSISSRSSSSDSESTGSDDHHRRRKSKHRRRKKHRSRRSKHSSASSRRHDSKKRSRHREESSSSKRHHRRHDSDSD